MFYVHYTALPFPIVQVPLSIQYKPEVSLGQALAYKLTVFTGNVNTLLSPAET